MRIARRLRLVPLLAVATIALLAGVVAFLFVNAARPAEAVPLIPLSALEPGVPTEIADERLRGIDRTGRGGQRSGGMGVPRVFLVRDGESVVAFVGADPWRGCALEVIRYEWSSAGPAGSPPARYETLFHDRCYGSLFDLTGRLSGGPAPYDLDRVETSIRDGIVYAHPRNVIAGRDRY